MKKIVLLLIVVFSQVYNISAGELNCQVQVVSTLVQGQGVDARAFKTLETAIYEFMNTQGWTEDNFSEIEKIDCNILINITSVLSPTKFKASIDIQARRPVHNSSYNTILFNYLDDNVSFNYQENQALEYSETTFLNNLTAILGFYAHYIIGLDYDSFGLKGGSQQYQTALNIVNSVSGEFAAGWTTGNNNRYWIINNVLDAPFIPLRESFYKYHRQGLDIMSKDVDKGRAEIFQAIKALEKVHTINPVSFNMQLFFIAKSKEIIDIFSKGTAEEKRVIVPLLRKIDPANGNKYLLINKG